jgi:hypothetical protein
VPRRVAGHRPDEDVEGIDVRDRPVVVDEDRETQLFFRVAVAFFAAGALRVLDAFFSVVAGFVEASFTLGFTAGVFFAAGAFAAVDFFAAAAAAGALRARVGFAGAAAATGAATATGVAAGLASPRGRARPRRGGASPARPDDELATGRTSSTAGAGSARTGVPGSS